MGGYDEARFIRNNVSFDLAPDISRDLVVGLQRIMSSESNGSTHSLLPSAHSTFIDSTIPYIYLPPEACDLFASIYGLVWNETYYQYLIEDHVHETLKMRDPNFVFEIANLLDSEPTVEITLPYSSLVLYNRDPYDPSSSQRYFPIQPAKNDTQLTLGRAFLQEAYLVTNYGHKNFSVSQCIFELPLRQKIVPILPPGNRTEVPTGIHLDRPQIVGIAISSVIGSLLLLAICYWLYTNSRRKNRAKALVRTATWVRTTGETQHQGTSIDISRLGLGRQIAISERSLNRHDEKDRYFVPEIATNSWNLLKELPDNSRIELPEHRMTPEPLRLLHRTAPSPPPTGPRIGASPRNPQRRHGLLLQSSGLLSVADLMKYWSNPKRLNFSEIQTETARSANTLSTSSRLVLSYLDRSLPPTPTSEASQESPHSACDRVAARREKNHDSSSVPLHTHGDPSEGFF